MRQKRAFTLIELITAVVIMAIAVVCSLEFYRYCHKNFLINSMLKLEAANFARETMEGIYFLDPTDSQLSAGNYTQALPSTGDCSQLKTQYGGTRTYRVAQQTDYKVIQVTVNWNP